MSALAGLSQQIVSTSNTKASEKASSKDNAKSNTREFDKKLNERNKFDPKERKQDVPVSKDYSVDRKRDTSPDPINSEKRPEEKLENRVSKQETRSDKSDIKELTKKEAMWAFLDRMDQDLGVGPAEVMDAFAKLDVDNLMAPPETSADEFVQNLNLQPGQEEQALGLFSQMLTWTSAAGLSEQLQQKGQSADLNVMNSQQYQTKERMAGLNDLSDKFFMNGQHTRDNVLQSRENLQGFAQQNGMGMGKSDLADRLMDQRDQAQPQPQSKPVETTDQLLKEMQTEALTKAELSQLGFQQKMNALKTYGQPAQMVEQPVVAPQNLNQMNTPNQIEELFQPTQAVQSQNLTAFADGGDTEAQMNMDGGEFAAQDNFTGKSAKVDGANFIVKAPQPTETEVSENIREIINKAKIMVKDGGGQMKVSLRPEGMGNVNLKVNVVGGDVSVEMITNSDETRKILEKGLGDLKDNLSLQKLNVEQIKVESSKDISDQLTQDKQDDAERGFQERFLQDFRNQNNSRWGSAFSVNPISEPGSQTLEDGEPVEEKTQKSRRLDLVA